MVSPSELRLRRAVRQYKLRRLGIATGPPDDHSSESTDIITAMGLFYDALKYKLSQVQQWSKLSESQQRIIKEAEQMLNEATEILTSGEYDCDVSEEVTQEEIDHIFSPDEDDPEDVV